MILILFLGSLLFSGVLPEKDPDAIQKLELCRLALAKRLPLRVSFTQTLKEDGVATLTREGVLSLQDAHHARWQYQGDQGEPGQVWIIRDNRYLWYQPEDALLRKGSLGPRMRAGLWAWLLGERSLDESVRARWGRDGLIQLDFGDGETWWLLVDYEGLPLEMRMRNGDNPDWMTVTRFSRYQNVPVFPAGTFEMDPPEGTEVVEEP